jgi:hypothetical protein
MLYYIGSVTISKSGIIDIHNTSKLIDIHILNNTVLLCVFVHIQVTYMYVCL